MGCCSGKQPAPAAAAPAAAPSGKGAQGPRAGGHVTVFALTACPHCKAAKELLARKGVAEGGDARLAVVNVTDEPWRRLQLIGLLPGESSITFPQIWFGGEHVGGNSELQDLERRGELGGTLERLFAAAPASFPPAFPKPEKAELLGLVPDALREKWQAGLADVDSQCGGGISSLLVMVEAPTDMIVLCTAGEKSATDIYKYGEAGSKGVDGGDEKLYCQMALERGESIFVDDPSKVPGLEKNEDYVKFGYGYYIGVPWKVEGAFGRLPRLTGTVALMEKVPGKLKKEHVSIAEDFRKTIERDLSVHVSLEH